MKFKLSFQVNKTITAGQTLRGTLNLVVGPKRAKAYHLKVNFTGTEHAKIRHKKGNTRVRTFQEQRELVCLNVAATRHINAQIQRCNNILSQGHYQIHFSIPIPSALPASCAFGDCNSSTKIEYRLQAELIGSGMIHDYRTRQIVQVSAKPKPIRTIPYSIPPQSHMILAGGLLNQGRVTFGVQADDTYLVPGQQLTLDLAVVNESLASIKRIQVVLRERAEWSAKENRRTAPHTTSRTKRLIDESWSMIASPVCKKQDSNVLGKTLSFQNGSDRLEQNFQLVTKQLLTDDNLLHLTLPPIPLETHSSYEGAYMKVTHDLTVTLKTSKWRSNPEFRIPVRIARHGLKTATAVPLAIVVDPTKEHDDDQVQTAVVLGIVE